MHGISHLVWDTDDTDMKDAMITDELSLPFDRIAGIGGDTTCL